MRTLPFLALVALVGCAREDIKPPVSSDYKPPREITSAEDIPKSPHQMDRAALKWDPLVCEYAVEEGDAPAVTGAVSTLSALPVTNVLLVMAVFDSSGRELARVKTRITRVTDAEPQLFTILAPKGTSSARIVDLKGDLNGKPTR